MSNGFTNWWKERVPTGGLNYPVPKHANTFLYTLGGITLVSTLLTILTGIILAQLYSPTPEQANESIRFLLNNYELGNFIRGLHYWAAQVTITAIILHLLRVFFYGSYKKPREANWLLGVILFLVMVGLYYTGTILKWDQEAFEALEHAQAGGELLGGPLAAYFAENPTVSMLSKFFSLHTSILPLVLLGLIPLHLLLIKALKISPLPFKSKAEKEANAAKKSAHANHQDDSEGQSTFLVHIKHLTGYGLIIFGVLIFLALVFPPALGAPPVEGIEATKPPWIFMSIFTIENWFGLQGLIVTSILLVIGLVLVPFIDRKPTPHFANRKALVSVGTLVVLLFIGFTVNAYFTKPEQHIGMGGSEPAAAQEETKAETDSTIPTEEPIQQEQSKELQALDQAIVVAGELKEAVAVKDFKLAATKAGELDETVDDIGDQIKVKDAQLREAIGEPIHELGKLTKETNPNVEEINKLVDTAVQNITKAKSLFN